MKILKILLFSLILTGCVHQQAGNPLTKVFDPQALTLPSSYFRKVEVSDVKYNNKTGDISYVLAGPALVRIRIGINEGPMLRTLVDWDPQDGGKHAIKWNGRDETGKMNFKNRADIIVVVSAITPANKNDKGVIKQRVGFNSTPRFTVEMPQAGSLSAPQLPVIKGNVPIRIRLAESDRLWLTEHRYEISVYIDYVFLFEDEEGANPYTFYLNTKGIMEGQHIITVNVISYTGEVGSLSRKVFIER